MSTREDALREPARHESLVFAMVYVGDQIAALGRTVAEWALHNDQRIERTDLVKQPAKAPQSEPPRPMGSKTKPVKAEPVEAAETDTSRDQ